MTRMQNLHQPPFRCIRTVAAAAAIGLLLTLVLAGSAMGQTAYKWVNAGVVTNGADAIGAEGSPVFAFNGLERLAIDRQSGSLYASYSAPQERLFYKFNLAGTSQPFSAVAPDTILSGLRSGREIAIDNSGLATQGRIYIVANEFPEERVKGLLPSGDAIPGFSLGGGIGELAEVGLCGAGVNPVNGHIWATFSNLNNEAEGVGSIREYDTTGQPTGKVIYPDLSIRMCGLSFDSQGNMYVDESYESCCQGIIKIDPVTGEMHRGKLNSAGASQVAVDLSTDSMFIDENERVEQLNSEGGLISTFTVGPQSEGIAVDEVTHKVYVDRNQGGQIEVYEPTEPKVVPTAKSAAPDVTKTSAVVHGAVNADGVATENCEFEWSVMGDPVAYDQSAECVEGDVFTGSSDHAVHAELTGLSEATEYMVRLAVGNGNGTARSIPVAFKASSKPEVGSVSAGDVATEGASLGGKVTPNGSPTTYKFELGTEAGNYTRTFPAPSPISGHVKSDTTAETFQVSVAGLSPSTTYHFRMTAKNDAGSIEGEDQQFTTFAKDPAGDSCPNAHVRQQTGTRLLLDCRAYELVSARSTGGYDVESDLAPGLSPLVSSPAAVDRVLYSIYFGSIPGASGSPTSFGHDPYVASRGPNGWSTEYVGLPADGMADLEPFVSPLLEADQSLHQFAFGGANICDPCFADGSTNIPLRLADGSLVEGMAGSQPAGPANPVGEVAQPFSADGDHFVFGSDKPFELAGNSGSVSIYDRNLRTGVTQVVSTLSDGTTMTGSGIAELGISNDGSRILIGKLVGTDVNGSKYFDLYLHVGSSPTSIVVADTPKGVLYNGMTGDGTMVYFTTADKIGGEVDTSPDLFRADVGQTSATVSRVSTGAGITGDTDSCSPVSEWNVASGGPNCGTLAFAGGAGVAAGDGTVYFLSPELLDGPSNGVQDEPNLYVVRPGQNPHFVAVIDDSPISNSGILHGTQQSGSHSYGDFQVTPNGKFAVFTSVLPITDYPVEGHDQIYRYDADHDELNCATCPPSGITATRDTTLPDYGSSLTEDGRVFFTTQEQLVLRDTNGVKDAYEWKDGVSQLISTGIARQDAGLLTASWDGTNVYFFTREVLAAEDENSSVMKIYDAREQGGFPSNPQRVPCQASDECHGAGSPIPPRPTVNTLTDSAAGAEGSSRTRCRKGLVKRHGKCVKRHRRKHSGEHRGSRGHG